MNINTIILTLAILITGACTNQPTENQQGGVHRANSHHEAVSATPSNSEIKSKHSHDPADPHMRMTTLRDAKPEDTIRGKEIAEKARRAIEKYRNHKVALREGFEILLPEVPQNMYHFNKLENYMEAESRFNPERPTSLLYEKNSDGSYKLIGVMYTAPAGMSEEELDERVPLSITQWHQHVNICLPKGTDTFKGLIGRGDKFGLTGSITTREECEGEDGQFLPRLLGWMVHLYPFEKTPDEMWSVERQMNPGLPHQH